MTSKDLLCAMPEGCIIGLSTAVRVVQNISRKRSRSSCTLYWAHVRPRCVMILVKVFLWSCVKSARRTKINADKLSLKGNRVLCCCLLTLLSCTSTCLDISSFQGTTTCGWAPGVAYAIPTRFYCCSSCAVRLWAIAAITSGAVRSKSGIKSIHDSTRLFAVSWNLVIHRCKSIVPLLCFMNCMNMYKKTGCAPLMK